MILALSGVYASADLLDQTESATMKSSGIYVPRRTNSPFLGSGLPGETTRANR
jgi:hypothetical protein